MLLWKSVKWRNFDDQCDCICDWPTSTDTWSSASAMKMSKSHAQLAPGLMSIAKLFICCEVVSSFKPSIYQVEVKTILDPILAKLPSAHVDQFSPNSPPPPLSIRSRWQEIKLICFSQETPPITFHRKKPFSPSPFSSSIGCRRRRPKPIKEIS